jgi:hypothetical protein
MAASVLSVFILLLGGMGLPLGIPPTPEDPVLSRVAPQDCLAYVSWSGMAKPSAESPNQTEQLLAEPEVVQMVVKIEAILLEKLSEGEKQGSRGSPDGRIAADIYPAAKAVLTRPAAIFLSKAATGPQGPDLQGGAIFKLDGDGALVAGKLEAYQKMMLPPGAAEKTTISGFSAFKIKTPAGTITWGLAGKYLVVGVGDGMFEEVLEKARGGSAPAWLADLHKQAAVARVSTIFYVNVKQVIAQFAPMGGPQVQKVLAAAGLTGVTSIAAVTGLSDADFVSRTLIGIDGEPAGAMHILSGKPLTAADLAPIPHDATFAVAARYDLDDVLVTALKIAGQIEPRSADEAAGAIQHVEQAIGVNIKDDLLKSLGDVWCFYSSPSEGGFLVTGFTGVAQVRDRDRLATTLEKLVTMANSQMGQMPGPGRGISPKIEKFQFAGQDVYFFNAKTAEFPFAPAWCLTEKELIVSGFPQGIKSYLSRGKGFRSLAASPAVAPVFASGDGPAVMTYLDTRQFAEVFYPLLCVGAQAIAGQAAREGVPLDVSLLPSASALLPHLKPSVGTLRRTAKGIEISSRGTIPAFGSGPMAVAPLFFFVGARHSMAFSGPNPQSMNNLKQIALAMLNYESAMGHFPTAYTADKAGKPLLSWRVAILPYLDQDALYRQFHLDEPWDSPNNMRLIKTMPAIFRSPASHLPPGVTNYLTLRCKESVFPGKEEIGMRDITDGLSNTLMVVEADDAKGVVWTKPDDLNFDAKRPFAGLGGLWPSGFLAALCDGSVRSFMPSRISPATMQALVGRADGNVVDWGAMGSR